MFLQRLPAQYKLALASLGESTPIETFAAVRDHVGALLATRTSTVSYVDGFIVSLIRELREEQGRLIARVDQLADYGARLSVNKTANRSHSKFWLQSKENKTTKKPMCWKHKKFKDKANSCIPLCSYNEQGKE